MLIAWRKKTKEHRLEIDDVDFQEDHLNTLTTYLSDEMVKNGEKYKNAIWTWTINPKRRQT